MYFKDAYEKGVLTELSEGYIFSIRSPDMSDIHRKLDPFALQMVSYSGLKAVFPFGNGVKFQAQGKMMHCMLEPSNFPNKHVEPMSRSDNTTAYMPYRFSECEIFFTKDAKYRVLIPNKAHETIDSFTVSFPEKGDLCILYFIFDKENIDTKVLPFIQDNIALILKKNQGIRQMDADTIAKKFMDVVKRLDMWEH